VESQAPAPARTRRRKQLITPTTSAYRWAAHFRLRYEGPAAGSVGGCLERSDVSPLKINNNYHPCGAPGRSALAALPFEQAPTSPHA
jgi:hypothetical protein